jgi:hypothetical protein
MDLHKDRLGQLFKHQTMSTAVIPPTVIIPPLEPSWSYDQSRSLRMVFATIRGQWQRFSQLPVLTISPLLQSALPIDDDNNGSDAGSFATPKPQRSIDDTTTQIRHGDGMESKRLQSSTNVSMINLFSFLTKAARRHEHHDDTTVDEDAHIVAQYQSRIALHSCTRVASPKRPLFTLTPSPVIEPLLQHCVAWVNNVTSSPTGSLILMLFDSPPSPSSTSMPVATSAATQYQWHKLSLVPLVTMKQRRVLLMCVSIKINY